jgi:hypothetical protein
VILNDQGFDLVDTGWAAANGVQSTEVIGGCFCCRFSDFLEAAERMREADVILAEPVGSCTDLAATVMQPLRTDFPHRFRLAPLTVLVDPFTVKQLRDDEHTAFLFENQLAEADLVCFTHSDECEQFPDLPGVFPRRLSGRTGEGVAEWLDEVLFGELPENARVLDLDYDRYAAAETALAWFDCAFEYRPRPALSPPEVVGPLMDSMSAALLEADARVVHLKVLDRSTSGVLKAAITAQGGDPKVEGDMTASPSGHHRIVVNVRAMTDPESLATAVRATLPPGAEIGSVHAFRPAPPKRPPERR